MVVQEKVIEKCVNLRMLNGFLEETLRKGGLNAYSVEINKKIVESDSPSETAIRIKKGATLTPVQTIDHQFLFMEDPETGRLYNYWCHRWDDPQYNGVEILREVWCIEKMVGRADLDLRTLGFQNEYIGNKLQHGRTDSFGREWPSHKKSVSIGVVAIPEKCIVARISGKYDLCTRDHFLQYEAGKLHLEGERDGLFNNILSLKQVTEKISQDSYFRECL